MYNYNVYAAMHQLGVTQLRTEQSKVLACILQNRDVLVRLCTGGGKSLLFQLPALLDEPGQLTLVFSPLLALQEDQVSALKKKGVRAALLNSSLSKRRHAATLRDFVQNGGCCTLPPSSFAARTSALRSAPHVCAALSWTRYTSYRRSTAVFARLTPRSARSSSRFAYRRKSLRSRQRRPLRTSAISRAACIWLNQNVSFSP